MTIAVDHVFVCCAVGAPEAGALLRLGLKESTPNEHPGQGTACRRFSFGNAYLELFWVCREEEAKSALVLPTRLFDRWSGRRAGVSPFGLIFRPDPAGAQDPPFKTWAYYPKYLPPGLAIELATGTPLTEPELFYLRWARKREFVKREPIDHAIPVQQLTGIEIRGPEVGPRSEAARAVEAAGHASYHVATGHLMSLIFDGGTRGNAADLRPELPLVLRW